MDVKACLNSCYTVDVKTWVTIKGNVPLYVKCMEKDKTSLKDRSKLGT